MGQRSRRHPLLIETRQFKAWRAPALLIAVFAGVLWWFAPPPLDELAPQVALFTLMALALLFFVYAAVGARLAYVECRPNHLLISLPLYRLVVSYSRIRTTRPVLFEPQARGSRQWLVEPFAGRTALALDLLGYPVSKRFLRLWLNEFMMPDNYQGFVLVTPDWMTLSRDIDVYRANWKTRRRDAAQRDPHKTSLMPRRRI